MPDEAISLRTAGSDDDDGTRAAKKACTAQHLGPSARRACIRAYNERKKSIIESSTPSVVTNTSARCMLPSDDMSDPARQSMARCLRIPHDTPSAKLLQRRMHEHLWTSPLDADRCVPFSAPVHPSSTQCLRHVGDAHWTADGLVSVSTSARECPQRISGTSHARCLLANRDLLFMGNSVVRRQMYTLLDVLAGPSAHRLLQNGSSAKLTEVLKRVPPTETETTTMATRIWDRDGHADGYHGGQLITIDLNSGEHRFDLPSELCGSGTTHTNFNAGRAKQWTSPSQILPEDLASSKWAGREWRPLVSMHLSWPSDAHAGCDGRHLVWAGSHHGSLLPGAQPPFYSLPSSSGSSPTFADRLLRVLRQALKMHLLTMDPSSKEWLSNCSVHIEQPALGSGLTNTPSAFVLFPTYHGERENFNGYCGDVSSDGLPCTTCSQRMSTCKKAKSCRGKALCETLPRGSVRFVEAARHFAASLSRGGVLDGDITVHHVRATPVYDDCWPGRDRCMGYRPCHERLDAGYICRATAMLCPTASWPAVLAKAKSWIPKGHRSASLLYLYDGQTQETADATFRSWGAQTVGFGSHAIIFGPQFANLRSAPVVRRSLALMSSALRRARNCTGHRALAIFRSPAFNFDPVNTFASQESFEGRMRSVVERHEDFVFLDNYKATFDAAFPSSDASIGVQFDRGSAFHYLDQGRYLMVHLLLRTFQLLVPPVQL
jgi:hypothetical protein